MSEAPAEAWARCRPYLEAAVRRFGEGDMAEVERQIELGRAWFMPGRRAAAVAQITRDANLWLAGGELNELLARLGAAEDWARRMGCDRMTLIGRRGWRRVLQPRGYRPIAMLAKDLI